MTKILKRMLSSSQPTTDSERIERAINNPRYVTMRVEGRGTLVVDASEVSDTTEFKDNSEKAKRIVEKEIKKRSSNAVPSLSEANGM